MTSSRSGEWVSAANNPRNEILTSYDTMRNYKETIAKGKQIFSSFPVYILKSPDMLADFNKEVHQKGLRDIYVMQTNKSTYHEVVKPLEGASRTVGVITLIVFLAGSLIFVLLALLAIRERKYEIGVLRAMGMKKANVALGLVYESILMIALCLMIGLPAGAEHHSQLRMHCWIIRCEDQKNIRKIVFMEILVQCRHKLKFPCR